ncbi:MAG: hypothetical protein KR126chlam6_00679 [Candidatus Anoxychlamydiales bacterium]|nr:hypothetical protein [Candidatus Anoxychlamydiales bacterium]
MHDKAKPQISKGHIICFSDFKLEEVPSHIINFAISIKEFTLLFLIIFISFKNLKLEFYPFAFIFSFSFIILKLFLVAFGATSKLERLHKIIEDKKWHIEHKREEEKKNLEEIYRAKGFSDKLLQDIVDTLSSDDNRLLQVMLEEEMGLTLGYFVHPLKQAFGALLGMLLSAIVLTIFYFLLPVDYNFFIAGAILIILSALIAGKFERTKTSKEIVWDLAFAIVLVFITHFFTMILTR